MKKLIKKAGIMFATLLVALQMYGVAVFAADGDISFTDPEAKVGEKVDVTVRVFSATTQLGNIKLNMEYNPELLKFEQGTNAVDNEGKIDLTADLGAGTSDVTFVLTFTTLKEGTAKLTVSDYSATNAEGQNVELTPWDSTITIGKGGPVEEKPKEEEKKQDDTSVTVEGENYVVNSTFSEKEIPVGFEVADGKIDGKTVKALYNKQTDIYLYSLKTQSGETTLFLSEGADSSLKKTVIVDVSMDKYIMILNPDTKIALPKKYQSTTMTLNGIEFSIWNNVEDQDYYLIYALNSDGKPSYYQYDAVEGTYQRCNDDLSVKEGIKKDGILNKVTQYISAHILQVMGVACALLFVFLIVIIVLAVKLAKRRSSKEYYLEDDEDMEEDRIRQRGHRDDYEDDYVDDYEDEEELSDYEMEFDDYYDEEEFDDEDMEDDLSSEDDEDEFKIDFIEL